MKIDLGDLNAFVAVARAKGFRDGARASGLSASGLSEAVRRLEAQLGVRLLHRTTRSVVPTEAGQRLLDRLGPALTEVEAALDVVNGFRDRPAGALRLNVPVSAVRLVLPAIVPPFLTAYPEIRLEIIADDTLVDVLAVGCDAGIRYDELLEQDMIAVPIGPGFSALRRPPLPHTSIAAAGRRTRASCSTTPACAAASATAGRFCHGSSSAPARLSALIRPGHWS
jgi:DNA-binding transcriptional LysR family regulator